MTSATNPVDWTITGQAATTRANGSGGFSDGVDVSYDTSTGLSGTVFITNTDYRNLDRVRQLVQADADHRSAVATLTSAPPAL